MAILSLQSTVPVLLNNVEKRSLKNKCKKTEVTEIQSNINSCKICGTKFSLMIAYD